MASQTPTPFKIAVPDSLLDWITQRVATARIPPSLTISEDSWTHGVPPTVISPLVKYWQTTYNWRSVEARLNATLKQFTLPISYSSSNAQTKTLKIHFVHHQSSRADAIPLLFQHGWPGSFLEVSKIIGLLTEPGEGEQAYHVVAPSLPGFVFSEGPKGGIDLREMAEINHGLMKALGYETYMVQGGDWGSIVVRTMALEYPESCVAIHLNAVLSGPPSWWRYPFHLLYLMLWAPWQGPDSYLGRLMWWRKGESGYMDIQGTKPQTLGYALTDSPVGMLAWIRAIMHPQLFNDVGGFNWSDEDMITWAMLYIIPGTPHHANIYTNAKGERLAEMSKTIGRMMSKNVDFGASIFPRDILNIPRWWAAVTLSPNIVFWKEHEKGGHFAATENPEKLVEDIRSFTKVLRPENFKVLKESGKVKR